MASLLDARVLLQGLVKAAELNGKVGTVVGTRGDRYTVELEDGKVLAVKEANLEVVDDTTEKEDTNREDVSDAETEKAASKTAFYKARRSAHREQEKALRGSCEVCGAPAFQKCSRCELSAYCSSACMTTAWKTGHKGVCTWRRDRADNFKQLLGTGAAEWAGHYSRVDIDDGKYGRCATGSFDYYVKEGGKGSCVSMASVQFDHCTTCDPIVAFHFTSKDTHAEKGLAAVRWTDNTVHWIGWADFEFPDPTNGEQWGEFAMSCLLSKIVPGIDVYGFRPDGTNGVSMDSFTPKQRKILELYVTAAVKWLRTLAVDCCACKDLCELQVKRNRRNARSRVLPKSSAFVNMTAYPQTQDEAKDQADRLKEERLAGPSCARQQLAERQRQGTPSPGGPPKKKTNNKKKKKSK